MAGSISVGGISTGLDTSSIVSKMIQLKRRPIDVISAKKAIYDTKLSELQSLNTKLLNFQNISKGMKTSDKFQSKMASFFNDDASSNTDVVTLTTSSTAASGTYSLVVNSLAKAEKEVTAGFSSMTSTLSTGTFSITVGSSTTDITIDDSNNTLTGLRNAINSSNTAATATILNDGSDTDPYRLVITSNNTGADNSISIDYGVITFGGKSQILSFTEAQSASDASITLDGISITKSSNTITDVIDGLTIGLKSTGVGNIAVESDTSEVRTNIETFISEYNDVVNFISDQLYFDVETGETGILFGNTAVLDLQNRMREAISSEIPGLSGTYTALAQVGITTNAITGNLEVDDGDLTDALSNDIDAVINLFISSGSSDTSGLGFIGYTEDTEGGTYDVQISGGQVQTAASDSTSFTNATGSGDYYSGASGTSEEGLRFSLTSLTDGNKGSITFSLGIAANFERILDNLTDKSKNGPLKSELDTFTDSIKEIEDSIKDQEERLALEEDSLRQRFAALESYVSKMQSQGDFLAQISAGLVASAKR